MKRILIGILVVLVFAQLGVEAKRELVLNESDNNKDVKVAKGELFTIMLPAQPSTGFTWEVTAVDPKILGQYAKPIFRYSSKLMGAKGSYMLRFRALKTGESPVQLAYRRNFEKKIAPAKTYKVVVQVQ